MYTTIPVTPTMAMPFYGLDNCHQHGDNSHHHDTQQILNKINDADHRPISESNNIPLVTNINSDTQITNTSDLEFPSNIPSIVIHKPE